MHTDFDLLMFGHFAVDRLVVDGRGETASGGGVYYGSVAACRLGLKVGVITRLHPRDFERLEEMRGEGVEVFAAPAPETSGIENRYQSADMERRECRLLGFAGAIDPADVPQVTAQIYAITPIMAGEVEMPLLTALSSLGPVALDVQGFVRVREGNDLVFRPWRDMAEGLARVTYLKVDRAEAEELTGKTSLEEAARCLADYGPREIVLTQSSGLTVLAEDGLHFAPFTPRSLAGRTGRGDTCFATYLGARLSHPPEYACRLAAAATTLKQEQPGPWQGTMADVEAVWARWDEARTEHA